MKDEIILEVSDLRAGYDKQVITEGISFQLRRGEILCLAGESGCGKSTVLKALIASPEVTVYDGKISLLGTELENLPAKKRQVFCTEKMGLIFRDNGFW